MFLRTAVLAVAISAVATLAQGQDATGNLLYDVCTDTRPASQGYCFGYIIGAADGLFSGGRLALMSPGTSFEVGTSPATALGVCVPQGVTKSQIIDLSIAYMTDHPAERHKPAPDLVHSALSEAFPC